MSYMRQNLLGAKSIQKIIESWQQWNAFQTQQLERAKAPCKAKAKCNTSRKCPFYEERRR